MKTRNNPLFSIIVPVYNVEKELTQCIESILNQSETDFELLLVDDGSSDNSLTICNEYSLKDNRIRVFHQENGGASKARNLGIDQAKGDLIVFIDSDDWVETDHLSSFIFDGWEKYDAVFCQWQQDFPTYSVINNVEDFPYVGYNFFQDVLRFSGKYLFILTINQFYRRTILNQYHIRFDETLKVCEDSLFTYEYFQHARRYKILSSSTYHYTMSDDVRHLTHAKISIPDMHYIASTVATKAKEVENEDCWHDYMNRWLFDRMDEAYKKNIFHRAKSEILRNLGTSTEILTTFMALKARKTPHWVQAKLCKVIYLRHYLVYCISSPFWVLFWHCFFAGFEGLLRRLTFDKR